MALQHMWATKIYYSLFNFYAGSYVSMKLCNHTHTHTHPGKHSLFSCYLTLAFLLLLELSVWCVCQENRETRFRESAIFGAQLFFCWRESVADWFGRSQVACGIALWARHKQWCWRTRHYRALSCLPSELISDFTHFLRIEHSFMCVCSWE